jgi:hypothetical protein
MFLKYISPPSSGSNNPCEIATWKQVVFWSAYSTLKMETICSSEMSIDHQWTTQKIVPFTFLFVRKVFHIHYYICVYQKTTTWIILQKCKNSTLFDWELKFFTVEYVIFNLHYLFLLGILKFCHTYQFYHLHFCIMDFYLWYYITKNFVVYVSHHILPE